MAEFAHQISVLGRYLIGRNEKDLNRLVGKHDVVSAPAVDGCAYVEPRVNSRGSRLGGNLEFIALLRKFMALVKIREKLNKTDNDSNEENKNYQTGG